MPASCAATKATSTGHGVTACQAMATALTRRFHEHACQTTFIVPRAKAGTALPTRGVATRRWPANVCTPNT